MFHLSYETEGVHDDERPVDWEESEEITAREQLTAYFEWLKTQLTALNHQGALYAGYMSGYSAGGLMQSVAKSYHWRGHGKDVSIKYDPVYPYGRPKVSLVKMSRTERTFRTALAAKQNRSYPGSESRTKLKRTARN